MKVTAKHNELYTVQYPCLMIGKFTRDVYLMTAYDKGTCIYRSTTGSIGRVYTRMDSTYLEPYAGTITLEN